MQEEVLLDGSHGVGLEVLVVVGVELSSDANVLGVGDHDVDVSGAVWVAAHDLEEVGGGTGGIDGILGGLEAVEPELALLVGAELASEVVGGLVLGVEDVVLAVGAGLPQIEHGVGDALAGLSIFDHTVEEGELAILGHVLDDAAAELTEWGVGRPEGAEDGGGGRGGAGLADNLVVDLINETRWQLLVLDFQVTLFFFQLGYSRFNTEDIADSPCLIAVLLVCLADGVDIVDTDDPLVLGELDLTAEVVQVLDEGGEDLSVAGLGLGAHEIDDMLGEVGVVLVVGGHCEGGMCINRAQRMKENGYLWGIIETEETLVCRIVWRSRGKKEKHGELS